MDASKHRQQLASSPGSESTANENVCESEGWASASEDELERCNHWKLQAEGVRINSLPCIEPERDYGNSAVLAFLSSSSNLAGSRSHVTPSAEAFKRSGATAAAPAQPRTQPSSSDSALFVQSSALENFEPKQLHPKIASLDLSRDMEHDSASQLRAQMLSRRHVSLSTCSMVVSDADDSAADLDDEDMDWDSGGEAWESAECSSQCGDLCWLPCEGSWSLNPSSSGNQAADTSARCCCSIPCAMQPCSSAERDGTRMDSAQAAACSQSDMDIKLVWPVCVPVNADGNPINARISAMVGDLPSTSPRAPEQPEHASAQPTHASGAQPGPGSGVGLGIGSVLVMAGSSMELLARTPIRQGLANCLVPASRSYSLQGTTAFQSQAAPAAPQIRVLTLFVTAAGDAGPAVNVLCAPPGVARELNELFAAIADELLALETDPRLPHVQLRDVHGYAFLPGSGKSGEESAVQDFARHISQTFAGPGDCAAAAAAAVQCREGGIRQRLCGGDARTPRELGAAQLSAQERDVCVRAWSKHFQPLLREVAYLLMCVPRAFSQRGDGSQAWDHHIYCKTLAGMVAFLEHHRCWHTLSALLQHANTIGVAFRYQGERISHESLSAPLLEQLLQCSSHDDITVQYLQQAPECAFEWQPRQSMDEQCGGRFRLRGSLDDGGAAAGCGFGAALEACIASLRQCPDRDDAALDKALAGEFKDWEDRWLVRGFTGTPIEPIPEEDHSPDSASTVSELDCGERKSGDVLPWEVLALFVSCAVIAMHYAYKFWGVEV